MRCHAKNTTPDVNISDFAPSDFHLRALMKKWLALQHFDDDGKFQNALKGWVSTQGIEIYEERSCELVKRYDKWLNLNGDYVEK